MADPRSLVSSSTTPYRRQWRFFTTSTGADAEARLRDWTDRGRAGHRSSKSYYWCACGQSKNQPFCDGSHKGSSFTPVKWDATESKTVYFCGCKHSGKGALCDGTHNKL